ncbi:MAG TPA: dihydrofolate reductase family protein [Pyrinomonadaceae bacterium]|nr:dihydrofolate reductase family protein [Pyrinomonadaceae bacterium]
MRSVVFGGANSLDNYFARKDHSVDWLIWSDESTEFMTEYWKRFDTIIMGRKTYEVALRSGAGEDAYLGMKTYVCSRTLKKSESDKVEIISEDAVDFVRRLKQEEGKDICMMGGGLLAKPLLEADLIDEIGFNIHPVLLGSGIPVFHEMRRQIDLELIDCQQWKSGCVLVIYRVKHSKKRSTKSTRR